MAYYNNNKGYVGYSRSVRSRDAIDNHEMPISLMKRDRIDSFLNETDDDFIKKNKSFLKKLPISIWKNVAKDSEPDSWHHTSSKYNKTNHYSLDSIASSILYSKNDLSKYKTKSKNTKNVKYGVITSQVWGGSKRRPRVIGEETHSGIIRGDWLYYQVDGKLQKRKLSANKTINYDEYNSYESLVKKNKEYKSTKRSFNKILKLLK